MKNKHIITGFTVVCILFTSFFFTTSGIPATKDTVPKTSVTTPAIKPPAPVPTAKPATPTPASPASTELNAAIEKIFIKNNKVFVVLSRTGSGKIAPEDYAMIVMRLETSKGPRQWSLAELDKARSLTSAGRVEFDTGIVLDKSETVKGILSFGKIEKPRQEALILAPAIAGGKTAPTDLHPATLKAEVKRPSKGLTPMSTAMAAVINRRSTIPTPGSLLLDDAGGIRMTLPGEGQVVRPGDSLRVNAFFLNALPDPTAVENVEFTLKKWGVPDVFLSVSRPYRQSSDDRNCPVSFDIPARGLPLGSDYYITATHPQAWGIGNTFTIQTPGEGQIRVLGPHTGDLITPGSSLNIQYQFSRHVGSGPMSFELYKLDEGGHYGSPAVNFTRNYRSGAAGPAEPIHTLSYNLPNDLPFGQYVVQITHPEASGRSSTFAIGTVEIRISQPRAGVNIAPGSAMHLSYQFSRSVGGGPTQFMLRKVVAETGGGIQRMPQPIASFTRTYRPAPLGTPEPIYTFEHTLPGNIEVGQYYWELAHGAASGSGLALQAFGRSATFNVTSDINGSGEILCDYGLESVTYRDGRPLDVNFRVGSGRMVRPEFRVLLRWNGVAVPRGYYPVGAVPYSIGVYSGVTREPLGSAPFRYRTDNSFYIDIDAAFARDRVPLLMRDDVIPLEFRLEKASSDTIDYYSNNNLLSARMGVSNAVENNMEIDLNSSDFSLTRTPGTIGSRPDRYHLTQRFKVRNLSGGSGVNTRVMGCVYRKDVDRTWDSPNTTLCGGVDVNNVRADWIWKTFSIDFSEDKPWEIPDTTQFRLVLVVDPDNELIDSNRRNNTDTYTFRIHEDAPGAGSGTVTGH